MSPEEFIKSLSFRAKITYYVHLFKAIFKTYHKELVPLFTPYVPKDGVILDVGGHAGQSAKNFIKMVPQGHVYFFEPGLYAQSIFKKVLKFKKMDNLTFETIGLSDVNGTAELAVPVKSSGSIGFGRAHVSYEKENTPTINHTIVLKTLDDYITEKGIGRIDFIKIDIEGHEMKMLNGAKNTIQTFRPVIYMEIIDRYLQSSGNSA